MQRPILMAKTSPDTSHPRKNFLRYLVPVVRYLAYGQSRSCRVVRSLKNVPDAARFRLPPGAGADAGAAGGSAAAAAPASGPAEPG